MIILIVIYRYLIRQFSQERRVRRSSTASVAKSYNFLALAREPSLDAVMAQPFKPAAGRCPFGFPAMMGFVIMDHRSKGCAL